jgi:putative cell wall-binding protein
MGRLSKHFLATALALGLLAGGLGTALTALPAGAATSPSLVAFVGSSEVADATGVTWTVVFTPSASGGLGTGNKIFVTFPSAFTIPSTPTIGLGNGFTGSGGATATASAGVVTITLNGSEALAASTTGANLTIAGITNPVAATYPASEFSVSTTNDSVAAPASSNVVITSTVTFVSSSEVADASGTTWTAGFTSSASGALVAGNKIIVTFPSAFGISSAPTIGLLSNFTGSGGATATASAGVVTITLNGSEALGDSTTGAVTIGGITNPAAGTYSASAFSVSTTANPVAVSPVANVVITMATATPLPTQIYGVDAIATSIAISQREFPTAGSAVSVVLARDDYFSDGLAGGPLAAAENGPLLLTEGADESASLDARTEAEIQRVLPAGRTVYILGGDLALSGSIDTTLEGLGYNVVREAGADEYATAVDIAQTEGNPSTVFEVTGLSFYDALSAVPAAIKEHAAILLTDGASESFETYEYLSAHPGDTRYTIGGSLAAGGADPTATNISGPDLFNTSAAVATTFFPGATIFGAATSAEFPDSMSGGVFMATGGRLGPILLVNPTTPLPPEITPYLSTLTVGTQGYVFGGPLAVDPDVVAALQAAVG